MFAILRLLRALFGIIFYWQVITVIIGLVTNLNNIQTSIHDPKIATLLTIKLALLVVSGAITYFMGAFIRNSYQRKYHQPYPRLQSNWML